MSSCWHNTKWIENWGEGGCSPQDGNHLAIITWWLIQAESVLNARVSPHKIFISKGRKCQLTWRSLAWLQHVDWVTKVNVTSVQDRSHFMPPDMKPWGSPASSLRNPCHKVRTWAWTWGHVGQSPVEGHPTDWSLLLWNCQGHNDRTRQRKCFRKE